ncbi:MAG: M4 family metallopeptidase [Catenulispora sp.]|nr:M4 family metallopeptidase [Catenulispora sp.]
MTRGNIRVKSEDQALSHPLSSIRRPAFCGIVPPHILSRLAASDLHAAEAARRTLVADVRHRLARASVPWVGEQRPAPPVQATPSEDRAVFDDHDTENLPGSEVRAEGAPPTGDPSADEAYDGLGATFDFYLKVYKRWSVDGQGLPLKGTVHYGTQYDNAFWNGSQMVFGDGDGTVFGRFTGSVDVIGHELTHGVTQYTANLVYRGQSGALNESVSDVFGSMVKQYKLGQDAADADWLIGAGLFLPSVHGVALRSMKDPGTAYDDPNLGKDPQPATMAGYVDTSDDDGGVHINSGIPNRAFYLAATGIGGTSWDGAGLIWYDVLTSPTLPAAATFATFGTATVHAAEKRFGRRSHQAQAVAAAWREVGVSVHS